jgi:vacuolar-type H+-ATPase subunit E/Vma4
VCEQVGSARLKGRADLLKALVKEAKGEADADMVLRPAAIDRSALQKIGSNFDIGDDVSGIGGFVLESADGSIVLDYRFDGRLDEAWVAALPAVNTVLFGDE